MKRKLIITVSFIIVLIFTSACQDKKQEPLPIDFNKLKESSSSYNFYIKIDNKTDAVELYTQSKHQDTRGIDKIKKIAWSKLNGNDEVCFSGDSIIKITVVDKKEEHLLINDKCVPKSILERKNKIIFKHQNGDTLMVDIRGCDEV